MKLYRTQQGFLMVAAVLLLAIISLTAGALVYMFINQIHSERDYLASKQAFYLAEGGRERGTFALLSPYLSSADAMNKRYVCSGLNLNEEKLGQGLFSVKSRNSRPFDPNEEPALLNHRRGVTETDSIIPTSKLEGYADRGRVMIDREIIDYSGVSQNDCGSFRGPCLIGVRRGRAGTTSVAHSVSTPIAQYQCDIESAGEVPNLNDSSSYIAYGKHVINTSVQLQKVWVVGEKKRIVLYDESHPWVTQFSIAGFPFEGEKKGAEKRYYDLSMLSYAEGWAVGEKGAILHFNGKEWLEYRSTHSQTLRSLFCFNKNNCIAVGEEGVRLHYDGGKWVNHPSNDATIWRSVHCPDLGHCFAVGHLEEEERSEGKLSIYSEGKWEKTITINGINCRSIHCVSDRNCWVVGYKGEAQKNQPRAFRFTGRDMPRVIDLSSASKTALYAVYCPDSEECWAVGRSGKYLYYKGGVESKWVEKARLRHDMYALSCFHSGDCYSVGQSGQIHHYDGATWSVLKRLGRETFFGVDLVGAKQSLLRDGRLGVDPNSNWFEEFQ